MTFIRDANIKAISFSELLIVPLCLIDAKIQWKK